MQKATRVSISNRALTLKNLVLLVIQVKIKINIDTLKTTINTINMQFTINIYVTLNIKNAGNVCLKKSVIVQVLLYLLSDKSID